MKNYIKYLKSHPTKTALVLAIVIFSGLINFEVNQSEFNLWLSIGVALFSILITVLILLQVWGEYKKIEGFWPAVKAYFKW